VVFLPGPLDIRVPCGVLGVLTGLFWTGATMWGTTEHRLTKAGFAPGVAEQARAERVQRAAADRRDRW
jgi:hypothetical protein